ncbi:MAG: DUF192 domain-containing protein [Rhodospirillaceae bacterium]|jgi:uncharacterized protein|nr:DUF192 domain-containing protein [Rhodospirillaceae bacterium]MBT5241402.1 DUF192 domain-containing protein [Rhodospirillaceae bacterium]MBT5566594.1 DUF192 domain-containing protein [Rhodospirillaceae bacterium]MBT6090683.1 DUF192 domain-containing protein [Rhodospirillaceae bacterium]MBT6960586.1 DUF192 domain-containing protein [Rhodospirillaceae bacterium]
MITPLIRLSLFIAFVFSASPVDAQFLRPHEPFDSTKAQSLPLEPGVIHVVGEDGSVTEYAFQIEFADTNVSRSTGLMHRSEIAADRGMLFDFKRDRMVTMWMRNTFIPLDMLFLSVDGQIITIAENTVPHSEKTVSSRKRVRSVLEVAAGTVQRLGIKIGDRVQHVMFAE